jgi:hypothetical protein
MSVNAETDIADVVGAIPYRIALAGGWIDQPFVSCHDPEPPGSMVVVAMEPTFWYMERAGIATGTRKIAMDLWNGKLPDRDPAALVKELYDEENKDKDEPSGSQDMIGLIYPGAVRLDYDFAHEGGIFPVNIESNNDPEIARWIQEVIHILPVAPRPEGYNPLGEKHLERQWVRRLGQSGSDCYDAILARDVKMLGSAMNECMACWEALLPQTVRHPAITTDLMGLLRHYQQKYPGAMYSGCGGGYLYVVSEKSVPGAFHGDVRYTGG